MKLRAIILTAVAVALCGQFSARAALPGTTNVTLVWNADSGAVSYTLYWGAASRQYTFSSNCPASQTSLTANNILATQPTYFAVTAAAANGTQSPYSAEVVYTPPAVTGPTVTLNWNNPSAITYGAALSSNQLNATANLAGSLVYDPPAGTVLDAGTNTLSAIFTPTGASSSVTDTVTLVVLPAPLTVTANDASRAYGQTNPVFTGTIFGLANGDNITATYDCHANSSSPVGTYAITPTLSGSSSQANYAISLVNGTLAISAFAPSTNQILGIPPDVSLAIAPQQTNLSILGSLGAQVAIQAASNLGGPGAWTTIDTLPLTNVSTIYSASTNLPAVLAAAFVPAGQMYSISSSNPGGPAQFYRVAMSNDYATLAYQALPAQNYPTRLIRVIMGGVAANVCYVTNQYNYIYYDKQSFNLAVLSSGPTIRQIANSLAGALNQNWSTAEELSYANGQYELLATVVESDPPSSDQLAGQQPPQPIQLN